MVDRDWQDSSGLRVRRWTRRGHDRLYVTDRDGQTLGYLDLRTDRGAGVTVDYLDRSIAEARRASRLLTNHAASDRPVVVTPVIAVVGAEVKGRDHARGVLVQPAHRLTHWLRWRALRLLDADQVDELYAIARRSTTWQTT